jgi:hypothetical protein
VLKLFRGDLFINFSDILLGHNMSIAFATPRQHFPLKHIWADKSNLVSHFPADNNKAETPGVIAELQNQDTRQLKLLLYIVLQPK